MKNLLNQFLSKNSLLHGLYMAILGAIYGTIEPFIESWLNNEPTPTLHQILVLSAKAAGIAIFAYISKNGLLGGSGTGTTPLTQSLINKSNG